MVFKISQRSDISVFRALDIMRIANERIAAGENIIHMEAGQPRDGAPLAALEHLKNILNGDPRQGYTEAIGIPALRERISDWYKQQYDLDIGKERIVISMGASGAFLLTFLSVFEAGDKVAIAAPGYPAYRNILKALDIDPVEIPTTLDTNYQPTLEHLDALLDDHGKLDGLIIASPSNPAGTILSPEELKGISDWCENHGVRLIADELYHGVTFEDPAETALRFTQNGIVINSFSKYFAMTGWRLGWIVLPADLAPRVKALAESLFVSPPTPSQHVAQKVFDHTDVLDGYVERYKTNLEILKRELPKAGFDKLSDTKGAFYLYADIAHLTDDSEAFCKELLEGPKIAMTPGVDFDTERGHQTVRVSFAGPTEEIEEACERLKKWYQESYGENRESAKA